MSLLGLFGKDRTLHKRAGKILDQIKPPLLQQIPPGCHLNESACRDSLVAFLRDDDDVNRVTQCFIKRVQLSPTDFIEGLAELKARELTRQAEGIYEQLAPNLSSSLPPSCSLKKESCVLTIKGLLIENILPEELVKRFVKAIESTPWTFIDGIPAPSSQGYYSGAPQSMSRSELR